MKFLEGELAKVFFERAKFKAHAKTGLKTATITLLLGVNGKSKGGLSQNLHGLCGSEPEPALPVRAGH